MRALTPIEVEVLTKFGEQLPPAGRVRFLADVGACQVEERADGARLVFALADYDRPPYRGQHQYPVEGSVRDDDGEEVSVSLYADENDRLLELELVKWSGGVLKGVRWDTLKLF